MAVLFLKHQSLTHTIFTKRPLLVFIVHWIAWTALYVPFYVLTRSSSARVPMNEILFNCGLMGSINFLLFYVVAFFFVPFIGIKKKRWVILIVLCLASAILVAYVKAEIETTMTENRTIKNIKRRGLTVTPNVTQYHTGMVRGRFYAGVPYALSIILIALAYRLLLTWYIQEKIKKDLENQKLKAELSFLKLQVNPHFLFNALNNIYSLAVIEKSKRTGDSIMKLSDLIRYMLYEKEDEENKVSLDVEIRHINSFIDLQKLRYTEDIYIQFSIEGETQGKKIPPLLLFPLIENSCKHGILKNPEKPVSIQIKVTDTAFDFSIHNFKNDYLKDATGGIGLENVRKRLALLFPGKHILNVNETNEEFFVELHLPLSKIIA